MNRLRLLQLLAAGTVLVAVYHGLAALGMVAGNGSPPERHAVFVVICLGSALYLLRRPLWGLPLYGVLVVQQTQGHGARAIHLWADGVVDWVSVVLLMALYAGLVLLVLDARDRFPRVRRFLCPMATS